MLIVVVAVLQDALHDLASPKDPSSRHEVCRERLHGTTAFTRVSHALSLSSAWLDRHPESGFEHRSGILPPEVSPLRLVLNEFGPRVLVSSFVSPRFVEGSLSGPLDRLTLGAGVTAQTNIRAISSPAGQPTNGVSNGATDVNWSGYAIWNAMAKYQLTDDTSVSLNANNLFDKHYYTQYGFYAGAIYGDPRNLSVTVSTAF